MSTLLSLPSLTERGRRNRANRSYSHRVPDTEIRIHLEDGHTVVVRHAGTPDPTLRGRVKSRHVFTQPYLVVDTGDATAVYPTAATVRIDIRTHTPDEWVNPGTAIAIEEISREDSTAWRRGLSERTGARLVRRTGGLEVCGELELVTGCRIYFHAVVRDRAERLPADLPVLLRQTFQADWQAVRHDGGITLVNPAKIAGVTFYSVGIRD